MPELIVIKLFTNMINAYKFVISNHARNNSTNTVVEWFKEIYNGTWNDYIETTINILNFRPE